MRSTASHARADDPHWRTAVSATAHCLTGCAIGEILGMVLATAFGWGSAASILLAVVLAFVFGYSLTLRPLVAHVGLRRALRLAVAFVVTGPVNAWLIARGRGHAVVHAHH